MSELLKRIRSRGHWQVVIRPTTFDEERIPNVMHLRRLVERCAVTLRGWDYPHVDTKTPAIIGVDWAGQEFEWEGFLEIWRMYRSGQLIHVFGMVEDWLERSTWRTSQDWQPGQVLGLRNAVFHYTEIFEFAARLAVTEAGDQTMRLEITVSGLQGRALYNDNPKGFPLHGLKASLDTLPYSVDVAQPELIAKARDLALKPAVELFRRFGKDISDDALRDLQANLQR